MQLNVGPKENSIKNCNRYTKIIFSLACTKSKSHIVIASQFYHRNYYQTRLRRQFKLRERRFPPPGTRAGTESVQFTSAKPTQKSVSIRRIFGHGGREEVNVVHRLVEALEPEQLPHSYRNSLRWNLFKYRVYPLTCLNSVLCVLVPLLLLYRCKNN